MCVLGGVEVWQGRKGWKEACSSMQSFARARTRGRVGSWLAWEAQGRGTVAVGLMPVDILVPFVPVDILVPFVPVDILVPFVPVDILVPFVPVAATLQKACVGAYAQP
eukprot:360825-Chlamydomonas_euryale.AAC.3